MNNRRRQTGLRSLAGTPVLVGSITVLIAIVTVFLAYNATSGLPFVATYRISATVPNANSMVPGNDVRIGGLRVGIVETIEPEIDADTGEVSAKLDLSLDKDVAPLPKDSTIVVRSRSALGLKYLEIDPGAADETLPEGSTLPATAARPEPVEIDEVFSTFDEPTRSAVQQNLLEFGSAIAGRGPQLNEAIGQLDPVLRKLQPVAKNLSENQTDLAGFFQGLEDTAAEVAPVAETQVQLLGDLQETFTGLSDVARPYIQDTITEGVATEDQGIQSLPVIRPLLRDSAALFNDLEPGTRALAATAPDISAALRIGTPVLARSPILNAQLAPTAATLLRFGRNPSVRTGIDLLARTNAALDPTLHFITPAQSVCNYATLLLRNTAGLLSLGDGIGTWQRFIVFDPPIGPNNEGSSASAPANGPDVANYLHYNPYPNTAAPGQTNECEAGNEPYLSGKTVIGNTPGNQGTSTEGQIGADGGTDTSGGAG